jgi:S-layer protein
MAYTYEQLTKAYAAVHGGIAPNAEVAVQLQLLTNASFTDADRLNYILNSADDSTAVAVMTYQFFTGKSPKADGIAWLLNSADNKNDLNDAAFANFNLEHRFMNFAASLALSGEGKAAFEAKYASLTYAGYVASIYDSIIGNAQARAAGLNPEAIVASVVARQDLILASARAAGMIGPNATAAEIDLALKTATAAYLLAEGIKADVGVYAAATNNFMVGLAKGDAVYNTDITQTYAPNTNSPSSGTGKAVDTPPPVQSLPGAPPPPPEPEPEPQGPPNQTFVLTTGDDKFTGGAGADTFTATDLTFTDNNNDILDGGDGADTLTIVATGNYFMPNNGVSNIETVTIQGAGTVNANGYQYAGLKALNVTSVGQTYANTKDDVAIAVTTTQLGAGAMIIYGGTDVTVNITGATTGSVSVGSTNFGATDDVVVNRETAGAVSAGSIFVTGGKTISITQTATNGVGTTQTNGQVQVGGSTATTEVTVKAAKAATANGSTAGINANTVTINDTNKGSATLAGTITKVSVDSFTTLNVNGTAVTDLSVANGSGNIVIDNSGLTTPTNKTLNLAISGQTGGTLDDADVYEILNVTTGAAASTLANITFGKLETLNVAGASQLTLTSTAGMTHLETVKISGAAGLTADLSSATVTAIDASATSGANTLTIDASKASFAGGGGADNITLSATTISQTLTLGGGNDTLTLATGTTHAAIAGVIDGGAGVNTLVLAAADAAQISSQSTHKFQNIDTIVLTGAANHTINIGQLEGTASTIRTQGGFPLQLTSATAVQHLELTGAGTSYILTGSWGGANDVMNVTLSQGTGAQVAFGVITAAGIETFNITSDDTRATATGTFMNKVNVNGHDAQTIVISGDAGVNLTALGAGLVSVDASGITTGGFIWNAGGVTSALSVKGSATGTNTVDLVNVTTNFDYVGGSGSDNVNVGLGKNTIDLGTGADRVTFTEAPSLGSTEYAVITGFGADDQLTFNISTGQAAPTSLIQLQGQTTLAAYLAAATTGPASTQLQWFLVGSDTYLIQDRSANATFEEGVDIVVKLVGVSGLTGWSVTAGTLSLI